MISWNTVFGEQATEDEIENIDDFVGKLSAYLVSFTTDAANRIVRNSGEGNGLEAWRRLHSEYDPTSSTRRVAILQQVQNPPRCQRVEYLGAAPEDWLSKKRQYEKFTDRNGRPDDSLVAAMFRLMPKNLEETAMFANEDEGFQELYDRLLVYSSTKQSTDVSFEPHGRGTRGVADSITCGSLGGPDTEAALDVSSAPTSMTQLPQSLRLTSQRPFKRNR